MIVESAGSELAVLTLINLTLIFGSVAIFSLFISFVMRRRGDGAGKSKAGGLWKRMLTFAVLSPLSLIPAFLGGWALAAFVALLIVCCSIELWGLSKESLPGFALALVVCSLAVPALTTVYGLSAAAVSLGVLLVTAFVSRAFSSRSPFASALSVASAIALYTSVLLSSLILIRQGASGAGALFFTLIVVQLADVGAMLGGMLVGKTALAPRLSPGKTVEGFISGVATAIGCGLLFRRALPAFSIGEIVFTSALLASYGLLGDLFASALKRRAGRKDFGKLLPGHGGFMDRADSLLVAAPAAWLFLGVAAPSAAFPLRAFAWAAVAAWGALALLAIRLFFRGDAARG
jgi:phosphatidate cytidylyltransferase